MPADAAPGDPDDDDLRAIVESSAPIVHSVLDSTADGVLVVDLAGRIVTYNRRFADMWDLPDEVLEERDDEAALRLALERLSDPDGFLAKVQQLYREPEAESVDVLEFKDGRAFERFSNPWRIDGRLTGRVWSFRDVTEQRRTADKLRASELYFRSLTERGRDLVAIVDPDGMVRYASPSHATVLGFEPEEIIGTHASVWVHPDDMATIAELVGPSPEPGVMPILEMRVRHRAGGWRVIEAIGRFDDRDGAMVINSRDVTARRHAELRTQTLLAVAGDIDSTVDLDEMLARVQRRALEALPADAIAVIAEDRALGRMRVIAHQGLPPELAANVATIRFSKDDLPIPDRIGRGDTLILAQRDFARWLPADADARYRCGSLIIAPFEVWSRHLGIFVAVSFGDGAGFDADQASLCTGIARQLAVAMEALELNRAQREEAEVAGALARVQGELLAHLDQPDFLDRLCRVTADVLHCESASTLLRRADQNVFVVIAGAGYSTAEVEVARLLEIPIEQMTSLLDKLAHDDVAAIPSVPEHMLSSDLQIRYGAETALCMALRSAGDVIGIQVANRRGSAPFTAAELRIARGVAQSASLALSHARLVEELEQANRVRAEFVATVSHELRTPLNIILGYGDLLLTDTFGPLNPEQHETLQRMDRRARELLELVNSTLEVSRLERGRVPIDVQSVSLRDVLRELELETHELQQRAGVSLRVLAGDDPLELRTDRVKLKVVLKNLVVNALKFTDHGGEVVLRAAGGEHEVRIEVADTGIGIPRDQLQVVFQAFRQAHPQATRAQGGVGLGLFIVARFVELLRGRVELESEVGVGTTFRVTLPRDVERDPACTATPG